MAYTEELKQLTKRAKETRAQRIAQKGRGWEFPRMSLLQKENRLRKFHPSYKEGSSQELRADRSKGYSISPKICFILESRSRVDPDKIDLSSIAYETDVLIIGGGHFANVLNWPILW